MAGVHQARAAGASVTAQVAGRPLGVILGIATSLNPFAVRERYKPFEALPLSARLCSRRSGLLFATKRAPAAALEPWQPEASGPEIILSRAARNLAAASCEYRSPPRRTRVAGNGSIANDANSGDGADGIGQNQKGSRDGGKPRGQCPAWRGRAYPCEDHRKAGDQECFDHGFPRTRPALVPLPSTAPAFASGTISDFPKAVLHPLSLPRRSVVHPIADLAGSIPQTPAVFSAFLVRAPPGSALPAGPALHRNDTLLRRSPAERTGVSL
jgi:hypothetical protein